MSKDNKSKFGELFEKSIKELDSDINKFITDKENLKENNSESSDKKIFKEVIISLEALDEYEKYEEHKESSVSHKQFIELKKKYTRNTRYKYIDLHNYDSTLEGLNALNIFFKENYGISPFLKIIHGKGSHNDNKNSPMRSMVRKFLKNNSTVLAYCSAELKDGGNGATYVLIKK